MKQLSSNLNTALKALAVTGIWPLNYAPPLYRCLWRIGIFLPPPHFLSFWFNLILCGVACGVLWGGGLWLLAALGIFPTQFRPQGALWWTLTVIVGSFFGLGMATYYQYGKWRHKLPSWSRLKDKSQNS